MNEHFRARNSCPGCKSSSSITLRKVGYTESPIKDHLASFYSAIGEGVDFRYLVGSYYILNECQDCGLIFQKEVPDDFLMFKLYEQWIDPEILFERAKTSRDATHFIWVAREIAHMIRYFEKTPGQLKFLDFGIGWSKWGLVTKGFGCDVYGSDISEARMDYARSSGIKVVSWEEIPSHQFDFISSEQTFEHLAEPLETLVQFKRGLKPGGIIRINVPNGWDIKRRLDIWDWEAPRYTENSLLIVAPLQHINCFNYDALVRMGTTAGLEVVSIGGTLRKKTNVSNIVRAALRPIHRRLRPGKQKKRRRGTRVFFQKAVE